MTGRQELSSEQLEQFLQDGVLVVENVLTQEEVNVTLKEFHRTLSRHGVQSADVDDDESAKAFSKLSSTNGSGGVLDIFYEEWKMDVAANERLFRMTTELWEHCFCHRGEEKESLEHDKRFKWHPYGSFDCNRGYLYIDRVCYRLPSKTSNEMGEKINSEKKKKARSIQRSLTPHLDCCPGDMYSTETCKKWRPIQCFISLTDNLKCDEGGFEAAMGFHQNFEAWANNRLPTTFRQKKEKNGDRNNESSSQASTMEVSMPAPCMGEYTHVRPKEDRDVMEQICHIPVPAGAAVFWDNRIPHANAYRHNGDTPRAVIYCSFLPDVALNRTYVSAQLENFKHGRSPTDQWNNIEEGKEGPNDDGDDGNNADNQAETNTSILSSMSMLGRKLMGIDPW